MGHSLANAIFQVGDRVSRIITIGRPERKLGTVTRTYRSRQSFTSPGYRMYAVKWDGGEEEHGYFEEGLERV
jgi:hypothetical protein